MATKVSSEPVPITENIFCIIGCMTFLNTSWYPVADPSVIEALGGETGVETVSAELIQTARFRQGWHDSEMVIYQVFPELISIFKDGKGWLLNDQFNRGQRQLVKRESKSGPYRALHLVTKGSQVLGCYGYEIPSEGAGATYEGLRVTLHADTIKRFQLETDDV